MRNYYDELEVSRNASPEIINRAYKVLAKKYHPDTTKENKQEAEERFKKISEAYETLSDKQKRLKYDHTLSPEISIDDYNKILDDNRKLSSELLNLKAQIDNLNTRQNSTQNTTYYNSNQSMNNHFAQETQNINNQYQQPNNQNMYNRVVYSQPTYFDIIKFKIKHFFKNALAFILTIALIVTIFSILLYIPFTRNYILNDLHFGIIFNFFN